MQSQRVTAMAVMVPVITRVTVPDEEKLIDNFKSHHCGDSPWMAGTILQAATPRLHWPVRRHWSRVGGRQSRLVRRPEITRFRTNRFRGFR